VLLEGDQLRAVDAIAAAGRRSRSFVVRDLLDLALRQSREAERREPTGREAAR